MSASPSCEYSDTMVIRWCSSIPERSACTKEACVSAFAINPKQREYEQAMLRIKVKLGEEEL